MDFQQQIKILTDCIVGSGYTVLEPNFDDENFFKYFWSEIGLEKAAEVDCDNLLGICDVIKLAQLEGVTLNVGSGMSLRDLIIGSDLEPRLNLCWTTKAFECSLEQCEEVIVVRHNRRIFIRMFQTTGSPQFLTNGDGTLDQLIAMIIKYQRSKYRRRLQIERLGLKLTKRAVSFFKREGLVERIKRKVLVLAWPTLMRTPFRRGLNRWRYEELNLDDFKACKLVNRNPLNSLVRREHFKIFDGFEEEMTIGHLIEVVKDSCKWRMVLNRAQQPVHRNLEAVPMHLNRSFWSNGNAYFLNNIIVGFRQKVPAYEQRPVWQDAFHPPFSLEFYKSFELMQELEITELLETHPISLRDGAIASGRHRVFAMIGRVARGEPYVPFLRDRLL